MPESRDFAGFAIERRLGSGGMGSVYLARHPRLPKQVALKLLNSNWATDTRIEARFEREADLVAGLDHPNIVAVLDRGVDHGRQWIAMQYVDGPSAADVIAGRTMTPDRAVRIVEKVAKALDYAHARDILHRDVKPANILLSPQGVAAPERVLLMDFGIGRWMSHGEGLTEIGDILATIAYAAPEQLRSGKGLDRRADVYALGVTLYELLTHELPYQGSMVDMLHGHVAGPVPRASETAVGRRFRLPSDIDRVLERALAKERSDRYTTCGELAAAARRALAEPLRRPDKALSTDFLVAAVVRYGRRVLLVQEPKHDWTWYLPGGRVRPGEALPAAMARKAVAEAGIEIALDGVLAVEHTVGASPVVRVIFVGHPETDTPPTRARWFDAAELDALAFRASDARAMIRHCLAGARVYPLALLSLPSEGAVPGQD